MEFIHSRECLEANDIVEIDCDTQCNIMLTTDAEFAAFKNNRDCNHYGGFFKYFPVRLAPPGAGNWNITIDVGEGYSANIRYSINIIRQR